MASIALLGRACAVSKDAYFLAMPSAPSKQCVLHAEPLLHAEHTTYARRWVVLFGYAEPRRSLDNLLHYLAELGHVWPYLLLNNFIFVLVICVTVSCGNTECVICMMYDVWITECSIT